MLQIRYIVVVSVQPVVLDVLVVSYTTNSSVHALCKQINMVFSTYVCFSFVCLMLAHV